MTDADDYSEFEQPRESCPNLSWMAPYYIGHVNQCLYGKYVWVTGYHSRRQSFGYARLVRLMIPTKKASQ